MMCILGGSGVCVFITRASSFPMYKVKIILEMTPQRHQALAPDTQLVLNKCQPRLCFIDITSRSVRGLRTRDGPSLESEARDNINRAEYQGRDI